MKIVAEGLSFNNFYGDPGEIFSDATLSGTSTTQFTLDTGIGIYVCSGTGFTYSGGHPNGGTITHLVVSDSQSEWTGTDLSVSVSALWSAISADDPASFANLLFGGNDTFDLRGVESFNVDAQGDAGNDTFYLEGNVQARIDGGTGNDTIVLQGVHGAGEMSGGDSIELVKLINGASYSLTDDPDNAQKIDGSALTGKFHVSEDAGWDNNGAVTFIGGAGNDTFVVGKGNDTFNAGAGTDTVDFSHAEGVTVNLSLTTAQNVGGGAGKDIFTGVENIIGSSGDDKLTGTSGDNVFVGGGGHDTIKGNGGSDTLSFADETSAETFDLRSGHTIGGDTVSGIDNIIGTTSYDTFIGNSANNFFDGRGDTSGFDFGDTVSYAYATGGMTFQETAVKAGDPGYSVSLFGYTATGGGQGTDTLENITQIVGTKGNDTFNFISGVAPSIDGGAGIDTLNFANSKTGVQLSFVTFDAVYCKSIEIIVGSAHADNVSADSGNNTISGGAGNDTLDGGGGNDMLDGGAGNDALYATGAGNNTLLGGAGNDTLYGNDDGKDMMIGGAGNDTLHAGDSSDTLDGGTGNDTLEGGTASYEDATGGVHIDLSIVGPQSVGGGQGTDTLYVNNLTGSSFHDTLIANDYDDVLSGGAGNDTLQGGRGDDTLNGGDGNDTLQDDVGNNTLNGGDGSDTLQGGLGNDTLNGGDGSDTASYADAADGVTVHLATAGWQNVGIYQGSDRLISIENLTGSNFSDTLVGNSGDNVLSGGGGNDTLNLGSFLTATDTVIGGSGSDTLIILGDYSAGLTFSATTMTNVETLKVGAGFNYNLTTNNATVAAGATLTVNASALGAGNSLIFNGAAEADGHFKIIGGLGADDLTGGAKTDIFTYTSAAQSSSALYDTIHNLNFDLDRFDVSGTLSVIDAPVSAALSTASFDTDLATAVSGQLVAHSAMLVTANAGTLNGDTFLVIEQGGGAGYQSGHDLVIQLTGQTGTLATSDFI